MAVLGLRFCVRAFSSCGKWGPLFIAVRGPLIIAASLVAEHKLQMHRLSSCGSGAQLLRGMWDPPRPGLEPVSPELAGRLSTTAPPGKPPRISHFLPSGDRNNTFLGLLQRLNELIDGVEFDIWHKWGHNKHYYHIYSIPRSSHILEIGPCLTIDSIS